MQEHLNWHKQLKKRSLPIKIKRHFLLNSFEIVLLGQFERSLNTIQCYLLNSESVQQVNHSPSESKPLILKLDRVLKLGKQDRRHELAL